MTPCSREKGFSLIEALVAMALISIASGAMISALSSASRNAAMRFDALAWALEAQDRLTRLESEMVSDALGGEEVVDEGDVQWVYEIQAVDPGEDRRGPRLFRVSLSVHTPDEKINPRMKIETYVIGQ